MELAEKVVIAFAALGAAAAAYLVCVALPPLISWADTPLGKFCLFVTVQVLIFTIVMLPVPDNEHSDASAAKQQRDHDPTRPLLTEEMVLPAMKRKVESSPVARAEE